MSNDIEILKKLLKVEPQDSKDNNNKFIKWTEVDNLIKSSDHEIPKTTNVSMLKQFLIAVIKALPKKPNQKSVRQTVHLAGRVWTHLITKDNTATNAKRPIRDAIKDHFFKGDFKKGEDFMRAEDVRFDDRQRTIDTNEENARKAKNRQNNAVEISPERVEAIVKQMVEDLESGEARYATVAILLGNLCLGSRWVETLMFSKFVPDAKETPTGRDKLMTRWVTQTGIAKKFNRGVDNRNFDIHKPGLPYVDAKYVVEKIYEFRDARPELKERLLSYNSSDDKHKLLANRYRRRANVLLQKRYFLDLLSRKEAKEAKSEQRAASTHLLRAIWVNLSFHLFQKKGQALDGYVQDMLGHDSVEPGSRYRDVKIVEAKRDEYLPVLKFGNVSKLTIDNAAENPEHDEDSDDEQEVQEDEQQDVQEHDEQDDEPAFPADEDVDENPAPPARRPPLKKRPDNLEEPEEAAPAQGYYGARYNSLANENKELKQRISKLEKRQTIIVDLLKTMQDAFAKLAE